ncbi:endodeoxyribonuclease [Podila humilis]|nr:endodeoxyribonuclease [Podila humilis]
MDSWLSLPLSSEDLDIIDDITPQPDDICLDSLLSSECSYFSIEDSVDDSRLTSIERNDYRPGHVFQDGHELWSEETVSFGSDWSSDVDIVESLTNATSGPRRSEQQMVTTGSSCLESADEMDETGQISLEILDDTVLCCHDKHGRQLEDATGVSENHNAGKRNKLDSYSVPHSPILRSSELSTPPFSSPSLSYKTQPRFLQTVQQSRETLTEKQEHILANFLRDLADGSETKLVFASRNNLQDLDYDEKNGVIRRAARGSSSSGTDQGGVSSTTKTISLRHRRWQTAASVVRTIEIVHENLTNNVVSSKRDIFYRDMATFQHQTRVDTIVEDLACTLETPRDCLNVVAASRSVVYGSIRFSLRASRHVPFMSNSVYTEDISVVPPPVLPLDVNGRRDCSSAQRSTMTSYTDFNSLVSVPVFERDIRQIEIHPKTKFILVIEKEAILDHLISLGFCASHGPCILLTSKGYPDRVSRRLLKRISDMVQDGTYFVDQPFDTDRLNSNNNGSFNQFPNPIIHPSSPLNIPLLALIDCDPYGVDIFLTYRCGSTKYAYDNENLAVPTLQYLGLRPSDWNMFWQCGHGYDDVMIPLKPRERSLLLKRLTLHPHVQATKDLRVELSRMLFMNCKSELQSLYVNTGQEEEAEGNCGGNGSSSRDRDKDKDMARDRERGKPSKSAFVSFLEKKLARSLAKIGGVN